MNSILISLVLLVSITPLVISTKHSTCFNYFLAKDKCVYSSASSKTRCPLPKTQSSPVVQFTLASKTKRLERRYDTTHPSFTIASGKGVCGNYDTNNEIGVCLWSGAEQNNPTVETAGWLNGLKTSNCGKRVYLQRTNHPETVQYAKVLDGCSFDTKALDVGCFRIGLTTKLFKELGPSDKEVQDQLIYGGITWDFDNEKGKSSTQGPV